jgi:hypothetical protein
VDSTLYPILGALFLIVLLTRLFLLSQLQGDKSFRLPGLAFKLFLCNALAAVSLILLVGRYVESTLLTFDLIRLSIMSAVWFASGLLLVAENAKGVPSDPLTQIWFVAAFTVGVIRLQSVLTLQRAFEWELIFVFVDLILSLLLAVSVWLFNGDVDELKESAAAAAASREKGSIQASETSPLLLGKVEASAAGPRFPRSPEDSANVLSKMFFLWTNSLYKLGLTQPLEMEDLWPLIDNDKSEEVTAQFEAEWNKELAKPREERSLKQAVWRAFRGEFILGGLYKLINDVLVFAGPLILNLLIQFITTPSWPVWYGVLFALGIFVASMIQTVAVNAYFQRMYRVGMRARGAMVSIVYRKAFDISNDGRQQYTTGEITNLMSVDSSRLQNLTPYLHMVWSSLLQIGVSLYLLYQQGFLEKRLFCFDLLFSQLLFCSGSERVCWARVHDFDGSFEHCVDEANERLSAPNDGQQGQETQDDVGNSQLNASDQGKNSREHVARFFSEKKDGND